MVETFFAQPGDHLNLRRNYVKTYKGLVTRLTPETIVNVNPAPD